MNAFKNQAMQKYCILCFDHLTICVIVFKDLGVLNGNHRDLIKRRIKEFKANSDGKQRDSKKESKSKDKFSKKIFWKGKYTVNE